MHEQHINLSEEMLYDLIYVDQGERLYVAERGSISVGVTMGLIIFSTATSDPPGQRITLGAHRVHEVMHDCPIPDNVTFDNERSEGGDTRMETPQETPSETPPQEPAPSEPGDGGSDGGDDAGTSE